jgi:hypothetical protein
VGRIEAVVVGRIEAVAVALDGAVVGQPKWKFSRERLCHTFSIHPKTDP